MNMRTGYNIIFGRVVVLLLAGAAMLAAGGCEGRYIYTVPEQIAPAGGEVPVVVRLNRSEVGPFAPPLKDAPVQFRIDDGPVRAAYTDKEGYAAAMVPAPAKEGVYFMSVYTSDKNGRWACGFTPVYVCDKNRRIVAVDLETILSHKFGPADDAKAALGKVAENANIVYLTKRSPAEYRSIRAGLKARGLPDGALLTWQRQYWYVDNTRQIPRMVVEDRLVNQLAGLKQTFPLFDTAICDTDLAARTFVTAGLQVIVLGSEKVSVSGPKVTLCKTWSELADK
ncbi:MAG: hypothetical protein EHM48_03165 [Planctomycetaceae bacterium]|nr:MAG: hypothetical protein EHM48_03165 [Planctomycetaceae bacterium]